MANIDLQTIVAPSLADSNFGASIKTQFENIDKNFKTLANWDFIRGRSGDSIHIESIAMVEADLAGTYDEWTPQWLYVQIANTVLIPGMTQAEQDAMLSTLDGGVVGVYYIQDGEDVSTKTYIGIEPYAFLDGRLSDPQWYEIPDDPDEQASLIEHPDGSCLVCTSYESDTVVFTKITAFPTIYYDNSVGQFCWKINGVESGIVARGPRGVDGLNGICPIVQVDKTAADSISPEHEGDVTHYKIHHVIVDNQWVDVYSNEDAIRIFDQLIKASATQLCPCFVFDFAEDNGNVINGTPSVDCYYLSYIDFRDSGYYVTCESWQSVSTTATIEVYDSIMKYLNYTNATSSNSDKIIYNDAHKGLFVPFVPGMDTNQSEAAGAHILFAIPNTSGANARKRVVFAPVVNMSSISSSNTKPVLNQDSVLEVRYKNTEFTGYAANNGSAENINKSTVTSRSVQDVFTSLYNNETGASGTVGTETRFKLIFNTPDWPDTPGSTDNRASAETYADNHPFLSFVCPDGFLWYKDPYTYLRIQLKASGQVAIIAPNNDGAATGLINSPANNAVVEIAAGSTSNTIGVAADSPWQITAS